MEQVQQVEGGPLYGKLALCRLSRVADHSLWVTTGRPWQTGPRQEKRLQELVQGFFGPPYALKFEVAQAQAREKRTRTGPRPLESADLQQQALEIFGGRWLPTPDKEESE